MKFTGKTAQWVFGGIGATIVGIILEQGFCSKNEVPQVSTQSITNNVKNVGGDYVEGDKYVETRGKIRSDSKQQKMPQVLLLPDTGQLRLYNRGDSEILLWGTKLGTTSPIIEKEPRMIPSGAFYYFITDQIKATIANGEEHVPLEIYLSDLSNQHYTANFILFMVIKDSKITMHTQQMGVRKDKWDSRQYR